MPNEPARPLCGSAASDLFGIPSARLRPREEVVYLTRNRSALISAIDGSITDRSRHGLFVHQLRILSRHRALIDGRAPRLIAHSCLSQHSWLGYFSASGATELRIWRFIGDGLHEEIDFTNHGQTRSRFLFQLEVGADFVGLRERKKERRQFGARRERVRDSGRDLELSVEYRARHHYWHQGEHGVAEMCRGLTLRVAHPSSPVKYSARALSIRLDLAPGETWHACLDFLPMRGGLVGRPSYPCRAYSLDDPGEVMGSTSVSVPEEPSLASIVARAADSAKRDLAALRIADLDSGDGGWVPAAGAPEFLALFGRDTLLTAWQSALAGPEIMKGTLAALPRWQGTRRDDWRDEEPGRIPHQVQDAPLSFLNYDPLGRYYGSLSSPPLYCEALFAFWLWTGDEAGVRRFLDPALRAMRWLNEHGDADRDGFFEYRTRSDQGLKNQGWKDSGDALVYKDGSQVPDPIATSEMQGLVYVAKAHLGFLLGWLGDRDSGRRLENEARELRQRFNERFWMEREGYFAFGLDPKGKLIRSISSDPGACLATGIVDESLAPRTAARLLAPDLFSGWGIRTLSSEHPAFDPFSYQRGTVWPVENAFVALGLRRYGLHDDCQQLVRAQFEAASLYEYCRLPEVMAGHQRTAADPIPVPYPSANWPQAWSSAAIFTLIQALLGLFPIAPRRMLIVDPHLPEWLPDLTLRDLPVGNARCTIQFFRKPNGESDYRVLELTGQLRVSRGTDFGPWDRAREWLADSR